MLYIARLFGLDVRQPPDDDLNLEAAEYRRRAGLLTRAASAEPQPEVLARFLSDWNEPRNRGPYVYSLAASAIREAPAELFADLERELTS